MHTVTNAARALSFTLSRAHAHSHAPLLHRRFVSHRSALALDRRALATKESAGPYSHISTVGVVGLGSMGHGVAQLAATAGYKVVVSETSTERLEKVRTAHRFTTPLTSHAMDKRPSNPIGRDSCPVDSGRKRLTSATMLHVRACARALCLYSSEMAALCVL